MKIIECQKELKNKIAIFNGSSPALYIDLSIYLHMCIIFTYNICTLHMYSLTDLSTYSYNCLPKLLHTWIDKLAYLIIYLFLHPTPT